jgi:hypothetical protein
LSALFEAKKVVALKQLTLTDEKISFYRNYFEQKALGANSV